MQIQVSQREIDAGLITYLKSRGFTDLDLDTITITYTQGRKGAGLTATLVEVVPAKTGDVDPVQTATPVEEVVVRDNSTAEQPTELLPELTSEIPAAEPAAQTGASLFGS